MATFGHLPYPPADLDAYLAKNYGADIQRAEIADSKVRYRLALRGGDVVGYCMMGVLSMPVDDARGVELHRLYVDESVKGAGVAAALMDDCIAWARSQHCDITLDGLGMLVEQAAEAFRLWHGQAPDTDPIYDELRAGAVALHTAE